MRRLSRDDREVCAGGWEASEPPFRGSVRAVQNRTEVERWPKHQLDALLLILGLGDGRATD